MAMNKTQRARLIEILRRNADAALEAKFGPDPDDRDDVYRMLGSSLTIKQLAAGIKDGSFVPNPMDEDNCIGDVYNVEDMFVRVGDLKGYASIKELGKKRQAAEKKLDVEIEKIEDKLIFEDATNVESIISGFELVIQRLTSAK